MAEVMSNIRVYDKCRFCNVDTPDHPGRLCPMNPLGIMNRRPAPNAANVELLRHESERRAELQTLTTLIPGLRRMDPDSGAMLLDVPIAAATADRIL